MSERLLVIHVPEQHGKRQDLGKAVAGWMTAWLSWLESGM